MTTADSADDRRAAIAAAPANKRQPRELAEVPTAQLLERIKTAEARRDTLLQKAAEIDSGIQSLRDHLRGRVEEAKREAAEALKAAQELEAACGVKS